MKFKVGDVVIYTAAFSNDLSNKGIVVYVGPEHLIPISILKGTSFYDTEVVVTEDIDGVWIWRAPYKLKLTSKSMLRRKLNDDKT